MKEAKSSLNPREQTKVPLLGSEEVCDIVRGNKYSPERRFLHSSTMIFVAEKVLGHGADVVPSGLSVCLSLVWWHGWVCDTRAKNDKACMFRIKSFRLL